MKSARWHDIRNIEHIIGKLNWPKLSSKEELLTFQLRNGIPLISKWIIMRIISFYSTPICKCKAYNDLFTETEQSEFHWSPSIWDLYSDWSLSQLVQWVKLSDYYVSLQRLAGKYFKEDSRQGEQLSTDSHKFFVILCFYWLAPLKIWNRSDSASITQISRMWTYPWQTVEEDQAIHMR